MKRLPLLNQLLTVVVCLLIATLESVSAQSDSVLNPKRCDINQLVLKTCPNRVNATFDDGRRKWSLTFAGPIALFKKLEKYAQKPQEIYIVDHPQFEKGGQRMLDVNKAWFLYDAEGDPELIQSPCIYAFRTKDEAIEAQKKLKGKLLQWDSVSQQARDYAKDWNPHGRIRRSE